MSFARIHTVISAAPNSFATASTSI